MDVAPFLRKARMRSVLKCSGILQLRERDTV